MFVVVTMGAEIFPVRAIRRIVVMIAVSVVDGQEIEACLVELPTALGTDRSVNFKRFCPVIGVVINLAPHPFEHGSSLIGAGEGDCSWAT
jgi:hypothetical protein